jgi:hypothetical protein
MKKKRKTGATTWVGALLLAVFVGGCGIFPHLLFSAEAGRPAWFYNSYDEGYYGWLAMRGPLSYGMLGSLCMRIVAVVAGGNLEIAMVAADFLFPFLCALAACFAVRPLTRSVWGMAGWAFLFLTASEMLAARSSYAPHAALFAGVESLFTLIDPRPEGLFPTGNQTGVFWLFRTPEPQITWTVAFLVLGLLFRMLATGGRREAMRFWMACLIGGFGYLLIVLPLFGAICFGGVLLVMLRDRRGWRIFWPAFAGGCVTFLLGCLSARHSGGDSLIFTSRTPAILLSGVIGGILAIALAVVLWRRGVTGWKGPLAVAFLCAPLLMANQHVVTGRMLYLFNFENFAFAQILAVGMLLGVSAVRKEDVSLEQSTSVGRLRFAGVGFAVFVIFALGATVLRSQWWGYTRSLPQNRQALSYVEAIRQAGLQPGQKLVCADPFVAETLPLRLGWRPDFVVARDTAFAKTISPLRFPGDIPPERDALRPGLFEALALNGVSTEAFSESFDALLDPEKKDWRSRFLLGGTLYSYADFWAPLTHHRAVRLDWIAQEKSALVQEYSDFLMAGNWPAAPTLVISKWDEERVRNWERTRKVDVIAKRIGNKGARFSIVRVHPPVTDSQSRE